MTLAQQLLDFYQSLKPPRRLPAGIKLLFPQKDPLVMSVVAGFLEKFYSDNSPRHLIFGINPGRFGAGTTGVNFTAPKQLTEHCRIGHPFKSNQTELSAEFIYQMITAFGGVERFYSRFFIASVSPLGFTKNGVNLNYYEDKDLLEMVTPFIVSSIKKQLAMGFYTDRCFCIGGDKNLKYFSALNETQHFFDAIIPLPHPRFIMQYRRKHVNSFIRQYLEVLR